MSRNSLFTAGIILLTLSFFSPWFTLTFSNEYMVRDNLYEDGKKIDSEWSGYEKYYLDHSNEATTWDTTKNGNTESQYYGNYSYYREGIPHCLIEALAASKPIITTDMPGCREVIHGNGILIQPKDSNALFNAMREMINTDKVKLWSENSFRLASKFDINVVNQQTLTVYGINK